MCFDDNTCPHLYFAKKNMSFNFRFIKEEDGTYSLSIPERMLKKINLTQEDINQLFRLFHGCVNTIKCEVGYYEIICEHPNSPNHVFGLGRRSENVYWLSFVKQYDELDGPELFNTRMSVYSNPEIGTIMCY
jgi:hypothetical protein